MPVACFARGACAEGVERYAKRDAGILAAQPLSLALFFRTARVIKAAASFRHRELSRLSSRRRKQAARFRILQPRFGILP